MLLSPISLKIILALLYEGASGGTKREIQAVLQFPLSKQETRSRFERILRTLQVSSLRYYCSFNTIRMSTKK